jgi:hypothetical protein
MDGIKTVDSTTTRRLIEEGDTGVIRINMHPEDHRLGITTVPNVMGEAMRHHLLAPDSQTGIHKKVDHEDRHRPCLTDTAFHQDHQMFFQEPSHHEASLQEQRFAQDHCWTPMFHHTRAAAAVVEEVKTMTDLR